MQHLIKKPKTSKTYKGQKKHNSAIKTHTKKYGREAPIKRDWSTYNRELINRGDIEVWIPKGEWYATEKNGRRGRDSTYSSSAFLAAFSLKELLGLTYRATEGFINSLMRLQGRDEKSPSYSRLCQVFEGFSIPPFRRLPQGPVKLLVDSTGIKVMGEGEWRRKKHGIEKSRKWVKLHLGFDYETGQVLAAKVTPSQGAGSGDCSVFPELLKQLEDTEIGEILADGAYDKKACYQAAEKLKAWLITPPMQGADYGLHPQRDRHNRYPRPSGRGA